ncbi:hypothetical protein TA3x_000450 [Tundrisphaera sp. TA3]|uniref:hypothetical protein n=1 Tax=Tundrisphaera sp. TA3 TaxID=3435775 RepID=UPI003EBC5299
MLITILTLAAILAAFGLPYLNRQHKRHMASLTPEERAEYDRELEADLCMW